MMDTIWPDENYMKKDFSILELNKQVKFNENYDDDDSHSVGTSSLSEANNAHKEIKIKIAEKMFEILKVVSLNNLAIQEYIFFDIVPNI